MAKREKRYWLVKSEPFKYSWDDLVEDGETYWDGVRNYQARNNLREMQKGDELLYYHSNEGLEVVGIAKVTKPAYQDPTTDDDRWVAVDVKPVRALKRPVSMAEIKAESALADMVLVNNSRLSVQPVTEDEFALVVAMSKRKPK